MFAYLDYRRFLRDYYAWRKAEGRGFSYRSFARRVGVASPNHLKRVIDGERNLSDRSASAYASALGLKGEHADYFGVLVEFNQSRTREERQVAYEQLRRFRRYREAHFIDAHCADYHAHWYVPAIRELALRADFRDDPEWIAPRMMPAITVSEARQALETLFALGMLVRGSGGQVRQAEPVVSTGEQTKSLHIARYHEIMLERAKDAISGVAAEERHITSLTFCVGVEGLERVRARIQRFRQELIAMLAEETEGEQVLQLGIQLFPLSKRDEGGDR